MNEKKEKPFLKILKALLVVVIPLLFILTTIVLFLKIAGFDIKQETTDVAAKIPVLSHFSSEHSANKGRDSRDKKNDEKSDEESAALKQNIARLKKQVETLSSQVDAKDNEINQLNTTVSTMKKEQSQQQKTATNADEQAKAKVIAQTYQNMDAQKAAAIFTKMSTPLAASYLNMLDNKTKAAIMENLDPSKAAKLTPLLKAPVVSSNTDSSTGSDSISGNP